MDTRRDFLKKATALAGGAGVLHILPASIAKAMAINPAPGSTFYDAEHIVLLMQENRSFDHTYGTLQGVRGFNDPRAIALPDNLPVWCQTNKSGETFAPFRLDIKNTNATWMESLPHGWADQVDARNDGKYDKWLDSKPSHLEQYKSMPLTLGFYTREDIPFYYSLADAFTVCDHNFCSSLTGTTANRLYFWTGTIREKPEGSAEAKVWNEDADYDSPVSWKTFPERLDEHNISWKVYQNEIGAGSGLNGEHDAWLGNFGDNPLEYFSQYRVNAKATDLQEGERLLRAKAFTTNRNDPHYHHLTKLTYKDGTNERETDVPKGDILFQFREDVTNGKLPAVSWLVPPQKFSDHPSSAWYGAWYISEVMDILTQNPEVWKKTIFILTYDENDGYFDHLPPYVPPHPAGNETGAVSAGIDTSIEYVANTAQQSFKDERARVSPIGLGYRVPMVIASPWSRGGWVNSQVFDHTSSLQFLEKFLSNKTKKKIEEPNISEWRRTVCGDLTSVFRKYNGEAVDKPVSLNRDEFIEAIHKAQFRNPPSNFKKIDKEDIKNLQSILPEQEKGTRDSNALPYEMYVDGRMQSGQKTFSVIMQAANKIFGSRAAGVPFNIYTPALFKNKKFHAWSYAVKAGDKLKASWNINDFENDQYHLRVYGPNGFYREFRGTAGDPLIELTCEHDKGYVKINVKNLSPITLRFVLKDNTYGNATVTRNLTSKKTFSSKFDVSKSHGWYDLTAQVDGNDRFVQTFAGRLEDGSPRRTDPLMGKEL